MNANALSLPRARLGFLGVGWIGRQRLEALAASGAAEVAACADADALLAARVAAAHPGARAHDGIETLLDENIDGVVIATPSGLHEHQAIVALERGLAVFCQKPLATSASGARRVIECAQRANRLLATDFCYREVGGMRALREHLRDGSLGEILAVDLRFHNAYAPSAAWCASRALAGGGCLLDLGVHLIDLASWLQDFPVTRVEAARLFCRGRELVDRESVEDLAFAQLRQENGACVRLACSWNLHAGQGAIIELLLHGTRGGASWRNLGGSFHDFDVALCRGDRREVLASGADDWGPRALRNWAVRLGGDASFDPRAFDLCASAAVIDSIYQHGVSRS